MPETTETTDSGRAGTCPCITSLTLDSKLTMKEFEQYLSTNESERRKLMAIGETLVCCKHRQFPLDIWYDCQQCLDESQEWAEEHGYTQCVTGPHVDPEGTRGTDNGQWVNEHQARWKWAGRSGLRTG